ncbi:MAG TPA: Asp-tRNA(Asn)/Glu-tRNA(Gln) amidotransferase subunit GatC [Candidatus Saccharimonadales bacterium]|nr:Asp-tRNA(Asn)/Glu-tRNA(Gln) amidotransferase subunit GatC [Candidatus Saccharimonadales bacterium]
MSKITSDDVRRVAALAKIAITDEEASTFTKELAAILEYVRQLDAVDVTGLSPTYQVTGLTNVMRKDELINYGVNHDGLLQNVPRKKSGSIEVPKVL